MELLLAWILICGIIGYFINGGAGAVWGALLGPIGLMKRCRVFGPGNGVFKVYPGLV